jgi:phage antirepressor YoqD-like protein
MAEYPEHEKIKALGGANQIVGDFIEWLSANGYVIARYEGDMLYPSYHNRDKLIAKHFDIDTNKLEAEKVAMLEALRQ